ncbi:hypothetical protein FB45DRAFT_895745 [Roridomyces roridus]|uniref:Uncharacterized protein n=1 Tax=Roridomyces roridus TaxID=1738132 RepID=A0AAD7FWR3_9AGAR|nr:hypothetical protein FB45DRAFT_895745 [Roridomyces roridus]
MSSAPKQLGALPDSAIAALQGDLITTAIQFFLHGIYTTLVTIALYSMWMSKTTLATRKALIAAVLFMFACANIQVISQVVFTIIQIFEFGLHPPADDALRIRNIRLSENVFGRINYFMSDVIVVWRAWVLWQENGRVKILLTFCILLSFAGVTADMTVIGLYLFGNPKFLPTGPKRLALIIPLMITNFVATVLFGVKAWQYRQQIKEFLGVPKDRRTNVERILVLLTESGGIYCLIWIPQLFIYLSSTNPTNLGYIIVVNMLPQLSAIYPVIIVLLVALERTQLGSDFSLATSSDKTSAQDRNGAALRPIHFVSQAKPRTTPTTGTMTGGTLRFADPESTGNVTDEGYEKVK